MSSQRYERINHNGDDSDNGSITSRPSSPRHQTSHAVPSSPPPSFRSRASSLRQRRSISDSDPLVSDADRTLADTFDAPSDSESEDGDHEDHRLDDRQRVMSGRPSDDDESASNSNQSPLVERRVTQLPASTPGTVPRSNGPSNDGVFANLSAKPERGEDLEEKPPTYEQAAADATPPYWENTILAPGGSSPDDVYIDGLLVGSFFSFIWNGMISMSFQLVGFLLTYLLHSTHAAKNGSKAGLGITLIQYGFSLKGVAKGHSGDRGAPDAADPGKGGPDFATPNNPNNHNFDPNGAMAKGDDGVFIPNASDDGGGSAGMGAMGASDWFAYALMIVGWFVLIKALSEYMKARRHEALVMQSPSRGLNIAVVGEGEEPARAV